MYPLGVYLIHLIYLNIQNIQMRLEYILLLSSQIICRFGFSRYIHFVVHLDIYLCLDT
jgi:hypothetical protein